MFGARIKAAVFSFSLLLAAAAWGQSFRELDRELAGTSDGEAQRILRSRIDAESDLFDRVSKMKAEHVAELRHVVSARARAEQAVGAHEPNLTAKAREIKSRNPLYREEGEKESSNWLAKAYERVGNALRALLNPSTPDAPNLPSGRGFFGPWLSYLMWGLLGLILVVFLYFAFRHFTWQGKLKRKAALMDEDEPERTLDEWLVLADQLEREGKFREAVRCLYLACLLKFDEHHVARFDRGQTNWEHLKRIEVSPGKPPHLSFREPTQAFDRVWYGMILEGRPDVQRFRSWYVEVAAALGGTA